MKKLFFILLGLLCVATPFFAQDGSIDNSFGTNGFLSTQFGITSSFANAVAIQSDGKIVVAGAAGNGLAIARYNADGSIDFNFGFGGTANHNIIIGQSATFSSIKIAADGKIFVGGLVNSQALIVRLTSNGMLDNGFGNNGVAAFGGTGSIQEVAGFDILPNGRIVGGGYGTNSSMQPKFCVFRLMPTGGLDANFGTGGVSQIDAGAPGASADCYGFVQAPDGKLLVCGTAFSNATDDDIAIARFNSNGSVDNSFGNGGKIVAGYGGSAKELARNIAIQSNGKIIAVGRNSANNSNTILVARFNTDGSKDNTFGTNGAIKTTVPTYSNSDGRDIVMLNNDKFLVCSEGINLNSGAQAFVVVRYNANGTLDNSFGSNGIAAHNVGNRSNANRLAVQADGKIVVVGSILNGNNLFAFAVARLNGTGVSGLFNAPALAEVQLFPNPTQELLNIRWTADFEHAAQVQVFDMAQRLVLQETVGYTAEGQTLTLSVADLQSGNYILKIQDAQGKTLDAQLFVKQ